MDNTASEFTSLLERSAHCFAIPGVPEAPQSLRELRRFLFDRGVTTGAWRWNGLDVAENRALFARALDDGAGRKDAVDDIARGLSRLHWQPPTKR